MACTAGRGAGARGRHRTRPHASERAWIGAGRAPRAQGIPDAQGAFQDRVAEARRAGKDDDMRISI